eukprot:scaffold12976_cov141-Cylindrotheca_fusiformis.AAC.2
MQHQKISGATVLETPQNCFGKIASENLFCYSILEEGTHRVKLESSTRITDCFPPLLFTYNSVRGLGGTP